MQIDDMVNHIKEPNLHLYRYIEKYIRLRDTFSIRNENNEITGPYLFSCHEKPLVNQIKKHSSYPLWILPIIAAIIALINIFRGDSVASFVDIV